MSAWHWYDVSPEDGCTLVEYIAAAESLAALAGVVASQNKTAQRRTPRQLLNDGRARKSKSADAERALVNPGALFWRAVETVGWEQVTA